MGPAVHPTNIDASEFEAPNVDDAKRIGPKDHETSADPLTVGEYVVVDVADGRSHDPQVFEPFFTTKEFGRGSGLGLSQIYGSARAAGGKVKISSKVGEGTTIKV
jgi:signal transduction histidine kinase